jgi:signal transduction histidine kinase
VKQRLGYNTLSGGARLYAGIIMLVVAIVAAGIFLLVRDVAREVHTNRLRADLVSGVSHELKTPVTVIRLYAETLLGGAAFDAAQQREFYRTIARESRRLASLIDGVLTFSRLERGVETYRLAKGDPAPVLTQTLDDFAEYLEQSGFRLERDVPESAPAIDFDPAALSQAVINLLENAVKYSGTSREVRVKLSARERSVIVEVEDKGLGIPEAEQAQIFNRFYRSQNGSGKGGYGLGLYLVRKIMDAHGGRAEVESQPGRGSRFSLVFPIVNA